MSYLKKEILDKITHNFKSQAGEIESKLIRNKWKIQDLAKEQATLKKQKRIIYDIIHKLKTGGE